jgi:nanoRNase/pAp phosphatase (c-di-AMP/oligoRNAs hydrolase)
LEREASRADIEAVGFLFPIANKRMLGKIQRGRVQRGYFQMLAEALRNARVYGMCIITRLGQIDNPDMIAEVADLLLREDQTDWTMCTGFSQGKLFISIRTSQEDLRADRVIHAVVAGKGTSGGHQAYAGGQIPANLGTESERQTLEHLVHKRFCRAVGAAPERGEKLIDD